MEPVGSNMPLDILDVLQSYSSVDKSLKQTKIGEILMKEYGYEKLNTTKRTTLRRNIEYVFNHFDVRDKGRIVMEEVDGNDDFTNFKYHHDFTDGQLRLIADSILFSKHIHHDEKKHMIKKLEKQTISTFETHLSRVESFSRNVTGNEQLFETIKDLGQAMEAGKKITFHYQDFVVNERGKLVEKKRLGDDGKPRLYVINPYELAATNGRYYLICSNDKYKNLANYRVDRIVNLRTLDEDMTAITELDAQKTFDIAKYMREHIYMFTGDVIHVKMNFKQNVLGEFIDWFGTGEVVFSKLSDDVVQASVRVNREAMKKWAVQYVKHVTVTYPDDLVAEIKGELQEGLTKYT